MRLATNGGDSTQSLLLIAITQNILSFTKLEGMSNKSTVFAWILVSTIFTASLFGSKCQNTSCLLAAQNLEYSCCCEEKPSPPSGCCSKKEQSNQDSTKDPCGCFHTVQDSPTIPATGFSHSFSHTFVAKIIQETFEAPLPPQFSINHFEKPPQQAPPILDSQLQFCVYQV